MLLIIVSGCVHPGLMHLRLLVVGWISLYVFKQNSISVCLHESLYLSVMLVAKFCHTIKAGGALVLLYKDNKKKEKEKGKNNLLFLFLLLALSIFVHRRTSTLKTVLAEVILYSYAHSK